MNSSKPTSEHHNYLPTPNASTLGLLLVAVLLFIPYGIQIWQRPHYEFSPLAIIGAIALIRSTSLRAPLPHFISAVAAFSLGIVALIISIGRHSTYGIPVAFLLFVVAIALANGGWRALRAWWPALFLLALIVRLPYSLDFAVVQGLRSLTTSLGSRMLDSLHCVHTVSGNVIEIASGRLMVEEACSGVNSLFSSLACTLFLCGLVRRGLIHTLIVLASVVGWVIVTNTMRIVMVVLAADRGFDLATGWRHDTLGVITYAGALLLTLSFDRLLLAFTQRRIDVLPPPPPGYLPEQTVATPLPAVATPPSVPVSMLELRVPGSWLTVAVVGVFVAAYLILFSTSIRGLVTGMDRDLIARADALTLQSLPTNGAGWTIRGFEPVTRSRGSHYGDYSRTWRGAFTASPSDRTVTISFDYPFPEWHILDHCYGAQGWTFVETENVPTADPHTHYLRRRLTKPGSVYATLLYTEFGPSGRSLDPVPRYLLNGWTQLRSRVLANPIDDPTVGYAGTVLQLQILVVSSSPLTAAEDAVALDAIETARRSIQTALGLPK